MLGELRAACKVWRSVCTGNGTNDVPGAAWRKDDEFFLTPRRDDDTFPPAYAAGGALNCSDPMPRRICTL